MPIESIRTPSASLRWARLDAPACSREIILVETQQAKVAVLLPTYNGARFIEPQIRSLKENTTPFALHWLDDHSTDNTREIVRTSAQNLGIELREWHQPQHQGVPGAFFQLLECVSADIYLFCDQDDIWQPGKIDATVASLLPDVASPVLCFSDPLLFEDDAPGTFRRLSDAWDLGPAALQESRSLMSAPSAGHTIGFTRPLREIFVKHKDIARTYAIMHDWWMYLIAVASGTARMLSNVPTTLYRRHGSNWGGAYFGGSRKGIGHIVSTWRLQHGLRVGISRQAEGFILASPTMTPGPKLERLLALAQLVATLDRRQSLAALVHLARRRAMWPSRSRALWLAASCLCSDAIL
jgi:glycosyltransferase involved in cell wall biosynthesis